MVWFTWKPKDLQDSFTLCKVQDNIISKRLSSTIPSSTSCCQPDENFTKAVNKAGIFSRSMTNLGVETFKSSLVENEEPLLWCCIIAQPVPKVTSFISTSDLQGMKTFSISKYRKFVHVNILSKFHPCLRYGLTWKDV